jgi:hypothetical protein
MDVHRRIIGGCPAYFAKRSRSFNFQNLPVAVRGTASMNS